MITIRMYNVGFGDCFMVTIPTGAARPLRMLFDCGTISAAPGVGIDKVIEQVRKDATDPGEDHPHIDVVVGTHRHRDHVSGFGKDEWDDITVGEVWMPWTEHPTDPEARHIRETQSRLAAALHAQLTTRLAAAADAPTRAKLERLEALAANALSNERAMTTLHEGFSGSPKRRFLPEQGAAALIDCPALPGVSVFVLGPSRDKDVIRDMDPPEGQSFLRLAGAARDGEPVPHPFAPGWRLDLETWGDAMQGLNAVVPDTPVARILGQRTGYVPRPEAARLTDEDRKLLAEIGEMSQAVAVSLDKAVNGTSLMVMLKIGQAHLLFPGDAQWGTWQAALRSDEARRLLEKVTFYKVGHHGSHNATPPEFVEQVMPDQAHTPAMVSTRPVPNWPEIPREPLLEALTARGCDWIRSDKMADDSTGRFTHDAGELFVDVEVPR
jgi:hypothetical protein